MRRFGRPPVKGQYYQHRPGAYGIFTYGDRLLLTRQFYKDQDKLGSEREWQLPGGGVEADAHMRPALIRGAYEETGWRVCIARKLTSYKRYVYMPEYGYHAEKICHIYFGRALYPLSAPLEENHEAALIPPKHAQKILAVEADREILKTYLGKLI